MLDPIFESPPELLLAQVGELSAKDWVLLCCSAILPSLLVSWLVTFLLRRYATALGLVDQPNDRKVHTTPTPLGGGIAIWAGVLLPFAIGSLAIVFLADSTRLQRFIPAIALPHLEGIISRLDSLWVLLSAGTLLMLVGLADDRWQIGWKLRLSLQFGIAAACVVWQGWQITAFINAPLLTGLLSVIWIVAMINSFNMLDNMDALSGGVAFIAAGSLAAVMFLSREPETNQPQLFVGGLLIVVCGALAGFLFHNRPPAKIFMGDAGSYFIGFCISVATLLATYAGYRSVNQHMILAPLFVMAVPMYDMFSVLLIRIREGRSPFHADKSHLSHRLVELGLSKTQAVLTIYLLTTTCCLGALLLHRVEIFGAVLISLMVLCILALIAILETTALGRIKNQTPQDD